MRWPLLGGNTMAKKKTKAAKKSTKTRTKAAPKAKKQKKLRPLSPEDVKLTQDVKRANQRLRELEKHGMENSPAYRAVERLAYVGDEAITKTGAGQLKFNTSVKKLSYNQRRHLEAEARRFLEAETSTVKGVKAVKERATKEYKKGVKEDNNQVDWDDWLLIWSAAITKMYVMFYGSDYTRQLIDKLANSPLTRQQAEKFMEDHFGEPIAQIFDAVPHEDMDASDDGPLDWNDLFGDDDDDDGGY